MQAPQESPAAGADKQFSSAPTAAFHPKCRNKTGQRRATPDAPA
jgi:hypothetical protein